MNSSAWPYRIEPMRLEDVPTVGAIEKMVFKRPWPTDAYSYELLENPKAHYLVARLKQERGAEEETRHGLRAVIRRAVAKPDLDKTILGYGGLWMMVDEAHICTLAVHPAWRRKSIGELLLCSLIEKSMELNASFVTLEVRVSNYVAQHLYEKYGFRRAGIRQRYYSDNNEDALIMSTDPLDSLEYRTHFQKLAELLDARLCSAQALPLTDSERR